MTPGDSAVLVSTSKRDGVGRETTVMQHSRRTASKLNRKVGRK
jgi:hypothetical protein